MIQFNLLPDVKLSFLKAKYTKRLVILVSSVAAIASLVVFIFLLVYVDVLQKHHLDGLSSNIASEQSQLGDTSNLNKILTIQNQLESLPNIDSEKPAATRLFQDLVDVTPASASISQVSVDFTADTMTLEGSADSLDTVNAYVDTLKFTTYSGGTTGTNPNAFSNVVLTSFGLQTGKGASYTINCSFDPTIFNIDDSNIALIVPNKTTTRSITQQPTDLYQKRTSSSSGGT